MVITTILKSIIVGLLMLLATALLTIGTLFFVSFVTGMIGITPVHEWTNRTAKALWKRLVNTLKFKTGRNNT